MFVSADARDDIGAALTRLRNYRSRGFVVFAGDKVTASGVRPVTDNPLARRLP